MTNGKRGFVTPLLALIVTILIAVGAYVAITKEKAATSANIEATSETALIKVLIEEWKANTPSIIPGYPKANVAFYGYPSTIEFIGNDSVIIRYENGNNDYFAVLKYSEGKFSYISGQIAASDVTSREQEWITAFGSPSATLNTYKFSSTREGSDVYASDWVKVTTSTSSQNSDWKTYTSASSGFELKYPSILSAKQDGDTLTISHSIPFKHPNPCDFKGDAPPMDTLTDFKATFKVVNDNPKDYVLNSGWPDWSYVSQNPFTFGSLNGYKIAPGVEGCGENVYFLSISTNKTLVIHRPFVTELSGDIVSAQKNLDLPGIIGPNQADEFFTKILSSLKFTNSPTEAIPYGWKTYVNPEYGFQIKYLQGTQINDTNIGGGRSISFTTPDGILLVNPLNKSWNNGVQTSLTGCADFASGITKSKVLIDGIEFQKADVSKDYPSLTDRMSVTGYCAMYNGIAYEIYLKVPFSKGLPVNVDNVAILQQMLSGFEFTE